MTVVLTAYTDAAPLDSKGASPTLDLFGDAIGYPNMDVSLGPIRTARNTPDLSALRNYAGGVKARLLERSMRLYDPAFVGSGHQPSVGGNVNDSNPSTLDEPSTRVYYTQSPNYSVIIKKKMFSGLQELYKPELMGPGETWLMRATKRLIARKCAIMSDYERISKIEKLDALESPASIMQGLMAISSLGNEFGTETQNDAEFEAFKEMRKAAYDRQTPSVTTYYVDPDTPLITPLGLGTGVFEITSISTLSTNLGIDSNGSCSFSIEDPYQILVVTEADIQAALVETSLTSFVLGVNKSAADALRKAQDADKELSQLRIQRGVSTFTFAVNISDNKPSAVIDALGMEVDLTNYADIPDSHALNTAEWGLFATVLRELGKYNDKLSEAYRRGSGDMNTEEIKEQMRYARDHMRRFFLGKSIIQSMDSVHVYIDGGTRRFGEGEDAFDRSALTVGELVGKFFDQQGGDQLQFNEEAIEEEYNSKFKGKTSLSFQDFKLLRGLDMNGNGAGMHVFGGLVRQVTDKYDASSGKSTLHVECTTNMEWLNISRYNTQPALTQTEGIVYDPLTPFLIDVDPATGLPTGGLKLTPENERRFGSCSLYFNEGGNTGRKVEGIGDMNPDKRVLGGNIISLYDHVPGMLYRWKEGIMTATYNVQTVDPKDKTFVDRKKLFRDIGYFASKTPFDNMDAANIISTLVTGFPYNYTTFVQSALQTGAFIPDTTFNSGKDFFHTFLNVARSLNNVQGNFIPFSSLTTDSKQMSDSLTQALGAQLQLSGLSSRMQQLRGEIAKLDDKVRFLDSVEDQVLVSALTSKKIDLQVELTNLESSFTDSAQNAPQQNNAVYIAGADVIFDLENVKNAKEYKRFGDRLLYQLLRRREDVIYNKDKTFLVISDEYDKDFDIQAYVLRLREQSPNLWQNTYQKPIELCQEVAKTLNFEFFVDTQGHIVFRPPQYNRTPLSVLQAMFLLDRTQGVRLFPDFLLNLFKRREDSIISDVIALELEIKMQTALLGASNSTDVISKLSAKVESGAEVFFISDIPDITKAVAKNKAIDSAQRQKLNEAVKSANVSAKVSAARDGVFSPIAQYNLQTTSIDKFDFMTLKSNEDYYNGNRTQLINLIGSHKSSYPEFSDIKVGATRNGQSTPATDVANIVSKISNLISRRSKLVRTLERVIEQTDQAVELNSSGVSELKSKGYLGAANLVGKNEELTGILPKIIEDTRKDTLGHMSAQRFIIRDEHIKNQSFTEKPPDLTTVRVAGTDPIVGEGGGNAFGGFPQYLALGADFDMWRQYGWRNEQTFNTPFFWDAELQCAPYAVMLLSRQRKNVVTGNVTVFGNEFYQLGDVVFSTNRQLLYYVSGISHNISYEGSFDTTLQLTYGHPPGEYIPTPLDVIGKSMTSRGGSQNSFRMNRVSPISESPVSAVLKFEEEDAAEGLIADKRNVNELKKLSLAFQKDQTENVDISPRLYILTFTDNDAHTTQMDAVESWFLSPETGSVPGVGAGADGSGNSLLAAIAEDAKFAVDSKYIKKQNIRQCSVDPNKLKPEEKSMLREGMVASDKAYRLAGKDGEDIAKLDKIVEVRIKFPPNGGWSSIEETEE